MLFRSSSIQSAKTRPGADCGSDHEFLIAKFRLKLKKVGKATRSFRYELNQSPYDYTVEATNRFKGLDVIGRVPEELWMEVHDIVQEAVIKTIPQKKKCRKAKDVRRGLTNSREKKRSERQRHLRVGAGGRPCCAPRRHFPCTSPVPAVTGCFRARMCPGPVSQPLPHPC